MSQGAERGGSNPAPFLCVGSRLSERLTARFDYGNIVISYLITCPSMRTIVDLPPAQLQQLDEICRREALSRAEAVRRAVSLFVKEHGVSPDAAFGLWKGRGREGISYQQALRDEWEK